MGLVRSSLSNLRTDPRLFKIPPYLSLLCMLGGIIWILLLPLDEYSRRTYISENALLPGQVNPYFHGSEQNIFRAYRHEIAGVLEPRVYMSGEETWTANATVAERSAKIRELFRNSGIKSASQAYAYSAAGVDYAGENVYGIVHAPRGDGTESIVLAAPIINAEGQLNVNGVTLLLTLARYFSRWSLWSKDIILLVTPDTTMGPQAWIDAYLSQHDPEKVASLTLKSGLIQGVVCIDYPFNHRFQALHISYDGINGQLPNLDLINTATSISTGQMNIPVTLQNQHLYSKSESQHHYQSRVKVLLHGMRNQAVGHSTGAHSVFMPYHIDAITLTALGEGWEDEMAFGRVVESLTRSLNNLLEKLHQSFFFYLLMQNTRFVSIGTYLPSAMAIAAGFTVMAIHLWVKSGFEEVEEEGDKFEKATELDVGTRDRVEQALADLSIDNADLLRTRSQGGADIAKRKSWKSIDRPLILPLSVLTGLYLSSFLPVSMLVNAQQHVLLLSAMALSVMVLFLPAGLALMTSNIIQFDTDVFDKPKTQQPNGKADSAPAKVLTVVDLVPASTMQTRMAQFYMLLKSLSLLVLGLQLTVLATLNFSLSFFLGIACWPLAFVGFAPKSPLQTTLSLLVLLIMSPTVVAFSSAFTANFMGLYGDSSSGVLSILSIWLEAVSFGWNVWGSWGILLGVFSIWLPAWVVAGACVISSLLVESEEKKDVVKKIDRVKVSAKENVQKVKKVVKEGATGLEKKNKSR